MLSPLFHPLALKKKLFCYLVAASFSSLSFHAILQEFVLLENEIKRNLCLMFDPHSSNLHRYLWGKKNEGLSPVLGAALTLPRSSIWQLDSASSHSLPSQNGKLSMILNLLSSHSLYCFGNKEDSTGLMWEQLWSSSLLQAPVWKWGALHADWRSVLDAALVHLEMNIVHGADSSRASWTAAHPLTGSYSVAGSCSVLFRVWCQVDLCRWVVSKRGFKTAVFKYRRHDAVIGSL